MIRESRHLFRKNDRDRNQDRNSWLISGLRGVKDGFVLIDPAMTMKEVSDTLGAYTIDEFKIDIVINLAQTCEASSRASHEQNSAKISMADILPPHALYLN